MLCIWSFQLLEGQEAMEDYCKWRPYKRYVLFINFRL
jgi:hypothetical protein